MILRKFDFVKLTFRDGVQRQCNQNTYCRRDALQDGQSADQRSVHRGDHRVLVHRRQTWIKHPRFDLLVRNRLVFVK